MYKNAILTPMNKQHSEEDINKTINFLKASHPEVPATREEALKVLNGMQTFAESFVSTLKKQKKGQPKQKALKKL